LDRTGFGEVEKPKINFTEKFWRNRSIDYLPNYPEKTDRMVQRLAAGKNPWAAFLVFRFWNLADRAPEFWLTIC